MNIEDVKNEIKKDLNNVKNIEDLNLLKNKYLSKKGLITELNSKIKDIPNTEKKEYGQKVNELRKRINEFYEEKKKAFDDEKLQSEIKSTIDKTVKDVCEDLNVYVSDKLTYVDAYNKEQLKSLVMEIDSTLTTEQVDAMTYEQMINIIKLHHIETAEIYSTELLELYNQSKEYEFKFAESKFTKDLISDVDPIKELLIKETLAFYDLIMASLEEKVDALNDARFEHFIKEDSLYQKANDSILNSKLEVIKYKNQLAELDSENQDNKDEIQKMLDVQIKLLDDAMANLQTAKTTAEAFLTTIENTINDLMVQIETLKNEIISLLNIDFEAKLTEKAEELDIYLNETKTKFFTEFENKYKDEILKAKQDVLAYKEQLKQSTTTTN